MFVQVSGFGCIDLGDRRSRVQISAARPINPQVRTGPLGPVLQVLSSRCTLHCTPGDNAGILLEPPDERSEVDYEDRRPRFGFR